MNRVVIRRLELQGFGVYGKTTRFTLSDGLNVFIAPNEAGKSTFLAGVQATLFGLPQKTDAQLWGTARFRSWDLPLPFRGQITLLAGDVWHSIHRNFETHEVIWTTAELEAPSNQPKSLARARADGHASPSLPPAPTTDAWRVLFHGDHRPSGRSESRARYENHLRQLLGIDDPTLFRLTYCITQDPEERSDEELVYRARQVPQEVQHLISGSGSRVNDVLEHLYDCFAAITQLTGDAGLVRPGNVRAANLSKPGRLEEIAARLLLARETLRSSSASLDRLHESETRLGELRDAQDKLVREIDGDQRLLQDWDKWARARLDLRKQRKAAAEIEHAIAQHQREENRERDFAARLSASLPEYQDIDFPFDDYAARLKSLADGRRERARLEKEAQETRAERERLSAEIVKIEATIQEQYKDVAERPDLLRDLDEWERVRTELTNLRDELERLHAQALECEQGMSRTAHWAALDCETDLRKAKPVRRLQELEKRVPRLLAWAEESQRTENELADCDARLAGELHAASEAPEELRREALQYPERSARLKLAADAEARKHRDKQDRLAELEKATGELRELESALAARLGGASAGGNAEAPGLARAIATADSDALVVADVSSPWTPALEAIGKKLECLQEEARLLSRIGDARGSIRRGLWTQVILPAFGVCVAVFALLLVALHLPGPAKSAFWMALGAGAVAGAITGALAYRKTRGAALKDLRSAQGKLSSVQRTMHTIDARLAESDSGLEALEAPDLMRIEEQATRHSEARRTLQALQQSAPSASDVELARQKAEQARAESDHFERCVSVLGPDPQSLVHEWESTARRADSLRARLHASAAEFGPVDWAHCEAAALPEAWAPFITLARLIAEDPARNDDSHAESPADSPWTGMRVISVLRGVRPDDWKAWTAEAAAFEKCCTGLREAWSRITSLGTDENGKSKIGKLEQRDAELAQACAPFDLAHPREEIASKVRECQALVERRSRAIAQQEPLGPQLETLETSKDDLERSLAALTPSLAALLRPAEDDPSAALARLAKAREHRAEIDKAKAAGQGVLSGLGAADASDLRTKLEDARQEGARATEIARALEERYPLLQELADADPEEMQRRHDALVQRAAQRKGDQEQLESEHLRLSEQAASARTEGGHAGNAAVLEIEVAALEREQEALIRERDACRTAFEVLRDAAECFSHSHRQALEQRVSQIFRRISLHEERTIRLEENFEITVLHNDRPCAIRQLSQGARDQLALSLRLAVAEFLSEERRLPLLFDDPFLSFDPDRLESMRATLQALAEERQIVLLSHRGDQAEWGSPIVIA